MEPLEKAEQLKAELDSLRPLDAEAERRILQKFRLDWNYHSNNLEGNSLTYGETKAFILFGITAGKKPFKDYLEIKGHNEAINWILDLVRGKTELTEVFIRQLHTLLLKESSESFAQTIEGKPTKKKVEVGKYKTQPNHVLTATGEIFYFATPEETPAKMQELIEWFRNEREKPDVNPIILSSLFHYRFIRIHPFDDGNGRVARILMNFILMQFGYPPVIIKTEDKENYYGVLHLADAGELQPFIEYITNNLNHSLEIMIKGARGEDIEEPEDLDKELTLLEGKLRKFGNKIVKRSDVILSEIFQESVKPLIEYISESASKFNRFYLENHTSLEFGWFNQKEVDKGEDPITEDNLTFYGVKQQLLRKNYTKGDPIIRFFIRHEGLNRDGVDQEEYMYAIEVIFKETKYIVEHSWTNEFPKIEKKYSERLSEEEILNLLKPRLVDHKNFIENKISTTDS